MRPQDIQAAKSEPEQAAVEQSAADLEQDAARLHREIDILEGRTKAIASERALKKKELEAVTRKLVSIRIKGMK